MCGLEPHPTLAGSIAVGLCLIQQDSVDGAPELIGEVRVLLSNLVDDDADVGNGLEHELESGWT